MSETRRSQVECVVSSSDLVNRRVEEELGGLTGAFRVRDVLRAQKVEEAKAREKSKLRHQGEVALP